jgi:hypothetical protein
MKSDRLEALLWARLDGTIDESELAELENILAAGGEPRKVERQIALIAEELDRLEDVQPPAELRDKIDSALAQASPPAARIGRSGAAPRPRPSNPVVSRWLPLAASLVVGVAIGYLLNTGVTVPIETAQVSGSMTAPAAQPPAPPAVLDLGRSIGSIEIRRAGEIVTLDLDLLDGQNVELILEAQGGERSTLDASGPGTRQLVVESDQELRLEVRIDGSIVAEHLVEASELEANQ